MSETREPNKKLNTFLFLIAASIFNILLVIVLAVALILLFNFLYRDLEEVSQGLSLLAVLVSMIGAIGGTFLIYSRLIRWISKKWQLDKYLHPVFGKKR